MWFAFRQRVISWFSGSRKRLDSEVEPAEFRASEPVLHESFEMRMENLGSGNVQIGPNNTGTVRVQHVTIHRYATPVPSASSDKPKQTPEQLKVYRAMRALPRSHQAGVLKFMQREFGSKRFTDISGRALQRVALYIEAIEKSKISEPQTRETT